MPCGRFGGGGHVPLLPPPLGPALVCDRPTLALRSALVPQTRSCLVCVEDFWLISVLS